MNARWSVATLCVLAVTSMPAMAPRDVAAQGFRQTYEYSDGAGGGSGGYGGGGGRGGDGQSGGAGQAGQPGQAGGAGGGGGYGGAGGQGGAGGGSYARSGVVHFTQPGAPLIVVTESMAPQTEQEWSEDLKVMDKLLRDAVTRGSGDASPQQAMGIRMTMMGGKVEPMYIEAAGALFGFSVNTTLAAANNKPRDAVKSPSDAPSAWERAKRDLKGDAAGPPTGFASPFAGGDMPRVKPRKFKRATVEELVDAALKVLPEASNLRHLPSGEVVFVTIAGVDEAGTPVRLTLKAKKADIDQAASGELSPKEFKERVARRIG